MKIDPETNEKAKKNLYEKNYAVLLK